MEDELVERVLRDAQAKRLKGREKYGGLAFSFVKYDTVQEMRAELLDLINYTAFLVIKLDNLGEQFYAWEKGAMEARARSRGKVRSLRSRKSAK